MNTLFGEHFNILCQRFDSVLKSEGLESVLIPSGEPKTQFLDDMDYPFKVNPHFKTWVPVIDNPHCWVVYKVAEKPILVFHQAEDFWHKPVELKDDYWTEFFDIKIINQPHQSYQYLPENGPDSALIGEWSDFYQGRLEQLMQNPESLINRLHFGRTLKSAYEISCIQTANNIAVKGHITAEKAFFAGESELSIHLKYLNATAHLEEQLPYGNIVAINANGAVLHYQHCNNDTSQRRRSFLIDAGANCNGYAADITRTYAAEDGEYADMLKAFNDIQQDLVSQLKPGLEYTQLHQNAHLQVAKWLHQFGLLNASAEGAFEAGVTQTFLPHGLGHFIGLQVHDVAGKQADAEGAPLKQPEQSPFLRLLHRLEAGHVLTIEPGVYFIPSLLKLLKQSSHGAMMNWAKVESMLPYGGIRIEDDIAITATGHNNLTRNAFNNAK